MLMMTIPPGGTFEALSERLYGKTSMARGFPEETNAFGNSRSNAKQLTPIEAGTKRNCRG
jgi:hypothetical protein